MARECSVLPHLEARSDLRSELPVVAAAWSATLAALFFVLWAGHVWLW